jgi:hypothetical protein
MKKNNLILLTIIIFAFLIRALPFWQPPSLNWDEVSLGYDAYSLLKTGRDQWGIPLPVIFRAFGDYKLPVYEYLAVPFVFSPRLVSVIAGTLLTIVTYAIAFKLFGHKVGLWSAFLVAVTPWSLFLSRIAVEANVAILFISLGIYYLLSKNYYLATFLLGISMWTYNSARGFVPLFLIGYWIIFRSNWKQVLFGLLIILPVFLQLLSISGQARYQWLAILNEGGVAAIEQARNSSKLPVNLSKMIHNRPVYFVTTVVANYLKYLSPRFLFMFGGDHYQFSMQNHGLLYVVSAPFFLFGIWILISNFKKYSHGEQISNLLLWWLIIYPVAGSITRDSPHTLRGVVFLPLPMILTGLSLSKLSTKFVYLAVVIFIASFVWYQLRIPGYYKDFSQSWQYGHEQVVDFLRERYQKYDEIIFTKKYGEPHEFILYYWPWDPSNYQNDYKKWDYHARWYWVDGFSKFKFVNDWEMPAVSKSFIPGKHYVVVEGPENFTPGAVVERINFLDGKPAFTIKEI